MDDAPALTAPPAAAVELGYAPPIRGGYNPTGVFAAGLATTAVAVAAVYWFARYDRYDLLGWHAYFIVPVGAIVVGLVAGSGYAVGSRATGVRLRQHLARVVCLLLVAGYFAGEYVQFAPHRYVDPDTGGPLSFLRYLHLKSTSWRLKLSFVNGGEPTPLGGFGYVHRLVDVGGFVVAGLLVAVSTSRAGYCDLCRVFLKRRPVAAFPASLPYANLNRMSADDLAAYHADQQAMAQEALHRNEDLLGLIDVGDAAGLAAAVAEVRSDQRAIGRLPTRLVLAAEWCPHCRTTTLRTQVRVGKRTRTLGERTVSAEWLDRVDTLAASTPVVADG